MRYLRSFIIIALFMLGVLQMPRDCLAAESYIASVKDKILNGEPVTIPESSKGSNGLYDFSGLYKDMDIDVSEFSLSNVTFEENDDIYLDCSYMFSDKRARIYYYRDTFGADRYVSYALLSNATLKRKFDKPNVSITKDVVGNDLYIINASHMFDCIPSYVYQGYASKSVSVNSFINKLPYETNDMTRDYHDFDVFNEKWATYGGPRQQTMRSYGMDSGSNNMNTYMNDYLGLNKDVYDDVDRIKLTTNIRRIRDASYMFAGTSNPIIISSSDNWFRDIENIDYMFKGVNLDNDSSLSLYFGNNITSCVGTFQYFDMFSLMSLKTEKLGLDIKSGDFSHVTDASHMFEGCRAFVTVEDDVTGLNNVIDATAFCAFGNAESCALLKDCNTIQIADYMFTGTNFSAFSITDTDTGSLYGQEISYDYIKDMNLPDIKSAKYMFAYSWLRSEFTADTNGYDVAAYKNLDLSKFNFANCTNMQSMFRGCICDLDILKFGTQNTTKVTDFTYLFYQSTGVIESTDLALSTDSAKTIDYMYADCDATAIHDYLDYNLENVTSSVGVFYNTILQDDVDLSTWDLSNSTKASYFFTVWGIDLKCYLPYGTDSGKREYKLHNRDSNYTGTTYGVATGKFGGHYDSIKNIKMPKFSNKLTSIDSMFMGREYLETVDMTNMVLTGISYFTDVFYGCDKLQTVENINQDVTMREGIRTFCGCSSMESLDLSNWKMDNYRGSTNLFMGYMQSLVNTKLPDGLATGKSGSMIGTFVNNKKMELSGKVGSIPTHAESVFYNCESIPSSFWDGLAESSMGSTQYMSGAFYNTSCVDITLGQSVLNGLGRNGTVYADEAFANCKNLEKVTFLRDVTLGANNKMFANCSIQKIDLSKLTLLRGCHLNMINDNPLIEFWSPQFNASYLSYVGGSAVIQVDNEMPTPDHNMYWLQYNEPTPDDTTTDTPEIYTSLKSQKHYVWGYFVYYETNGTGVYTDGSDEANVPYRYDATEIVTPDYTMLGGNLVDYCLTDTISLNRLNTASNSTFNVDDNVLDSIGLELGETEVDKGTLHVYCLWEGNHYNVSFDKNADDAVGTMSDINCVYGDVYTLPTCGFTRTDYRFKGWSLTHNGFAQLSDGEQFSSLGDGTTDIVLYAIWTKNEKIVNFYDNDDNLLTRGYIKEGSLLNDGKYYIFDNEKVSLMQDAVYSAAYKQDIDAGKQYYDFDGWYDKDTGERWDFNDAVTSDLNLKCKLVPEKYKLTLFVSGAGGGTYYRWYTYGKDYNLPDVIKDGYEKDDWYEDEEMTQTISKITSGTHGSKSLYTNMKAINYNLTYNLNGGELEEGKENPSKYNIETPTFTLNNPKMNYYDFVGWLNHNDTDIDNATTEMKIEQGSIGAKEFDAVFKPTDYTITYDYDGGTTKEGEDNPTSYTVETATFDIHNPIKDGYDFIGWNTAGNTSVSVEHGSHGNIVLKALWQIKEFDITYNYNGGELVGGLTNPSKYTIETDDFTLHNPQKLYYDFDGWNTSGNTTETIAKGSYGDKSYNALYTPVDYSITYDYDGGTLASGESNPTSYNVETADFTLKNPTKNGYIFDGWNTSGNITETVSTGSHGDKTYTALWVEATYNITYEYNGGTVSEANPTTYTINTPTFTLNNPSKDYYDFDGWNTSGNKTVKVEKGSSGDKSYNALYKPTEYTISYNYNGGELESGDTNPTTYNVETDDFTLNNPVRSGYTFKGWNTDDNINVKVTKGSHGNLSYEALWTRNNYTISYDYNGGSLGAGEENPTSYSVDTPTFTLYNPSKIGYNFDGWNTSGNKTVKIEKGSTGNLDFSALYTLINYPITYKYHGGTLGSGESNPSEYTIETDDFTLKNPSKTGYTFDGWNTSGNTTEIVTKGSHGAKTYDALYNVINYDITYDYNGGDLPTGVTNRTTYTIEDEFTVNRPVREGYSFVGWNGVVGDYSVSKGTTGAINLVADWVIANYNITYDYNGGHLPDDVTNVTEYGELTPDFRINNPVRKGYEFDGWVGYDEKNVWIRKGSKGDKTFKAKWKVIEYDINYDYNGGELKDGDTNPTKYTIKDDDIEIKNPKKRGYDFKDWSGDYTGGTVTIPSGSTGDINITANYDIITYDIVYDYDGGLPPEEGNPPTYTVEDEVTLKDGSKTGYNPDGFTGDGVDGNKIEKGTIGDKSITQRWDIIHYNLTYDYNGGETKEGEDNPTSYTVNDTFTLYEPEREDNIFKGWNGIDGDYTVPVGTTGDIHFVTDWKVKDHSIDYEYNGGKLEDGKENPTIFNRLTTPFTLYNPLKRGYDFSGWNDEGETNVTVNTSIGHDLFFNALYGLIHYSIDYEYHGGTTKIDNPTSYTINDEFTLDNPNKRGYDFRGWNTDGNITERIEKGTIGRKSYDTIWNLKEYKISYDYNGGTPPEGGNPTSYTIIDEIRPVPPTKDDDDFDHWDFVPDGTPDPENPTGDGGNIPQGSTGDITIIARWNNLGTVEGTITDENGKGIEGVVVKLDEDEDKTNNDGKFSFKKVPVGEHSLIVDGVSTFKVLLKAGDSNCYILSSDDDFDVSNYADNLYVSISAVKKAEPVPTATPVIILPSSVPVTAKPSATPTEEPVKTPTPLQVTPNIEVSKPPVVESNPPAVVSEAPSGGDVPIVDTPEPTKSSKATKKPSKPKKTKKPKKPSKSTPKPKKVHKPTPKPTKRPVNTPEVSKPVPKTGDMHNGIALEIVLILIGIGAGIGLYRVRRRYK